ncbi:NADH-quinone oxidoreductase subunit K [Wenzhouxiangella sp. XN24]|uniref:NADH-quinone oxidoreductase subunit K n=1 Tax=Wenzhouxiangella sp. XN24 TaxID=2713569 RepID=UPI0013EA081B|nr:Na+/H+ antiporter subunit C [Wenzhouxiangella sp. XN24]
MNGLTVFALTGIGLLVIGVWALVLRAHLIRKVLALNVMGSGAFLLLVGAGAGAAPDPVPQAMVITGIVVTVSATALALALVLRIDAATGKPTLPEDRDRDLMDEDWQ